MKIEQLHIDGFGHFFDRPIGPLTSNFVVFHGANEAGKSTLHNFLQTVLFGFGRAGSALAPVPALAGGKHGGRVVITGTDGGRYTVERHAGPHGGTVRMTMPDGSTGGADELARLLDIPVEVYCNVFSFNLEQLFNERSLENDAIKTHLYGAGMGVGNLQSGLARLSEHMDEIFLPTGRQRSRKVTDLVNRISEIDRSLSVARREAETWHQLQERLGQIAATISAKQKETAQVEAERRRLQAVVHAMDDWEALQAQVARLDILPEITTFPEDGPARLEVLEASLAGARLEEQRVLQQLTEAQAGLDQPVADAVLVDCQEDIGQLRDELGSFNDRLDREARLAREIESGRQQIATELAEIDPGWTVERAVALDTSVAEREEIAAHRRVLNAAAADLQQLQHQLESATTEAERAAATLALAEQQLVSKQAIVTSKPALNALQLQVRQARDAHLDLQDAREQFERHRQVLATAGSDNSRPSIGNGFLVAGGGLMLFGIVAAIAGLVADTTTGLVIGLVALAAGVGVLLYGQRGAVRERNASGTGDPAQQLRANLAVAQQRADETFASLHLTDTTRPESVLSTLQDRLANATNLLQQVENANTDSRSRQESLERIQARVARAQAAQSQAATDWCTWLAVRGLRESMTPDTAEAMLDRVGRIRDGQQRLEQLQREHTDLTTWIGAFSDRYRQVVTALGETGVTALADIAPAARTLVERHDTARAALEQRAGRERHLVAVRQDLEQRRQEREALEAQLAELLRLGGATDGEAFRTRARQAAERREVEQRRAEIEHRLKRRVPEGQDWQQFSETLEYADMGTLQRQTGEFAEQIEDIAEEIAALQNESGSVQQEMSRLANDQTAGDLRLERAQLDDQLAEYAREWSSYAIAREILTRARARYEAERQPEVLQLAEQVFRDLTGGRYVGVMSPVGSNEIKVVRADERQVAIDELSQGTRDQLFLALRFGLIASFGRTTAHLPVIVDDVLVNFDPRRAHAAAAAFAGLSSSNQVLLFTCHDTTVDHIRNVMPDAQIIDLQVPAAAG